MRHVFEQHKRAQQHPAIHADLKRDHRQGVGLDRIDQRLAGVALAHAHGGQELKQDAEQVRSDEFGDKVAEQQRTGDAETGQSDNRNRHRVAQRAATAAMGGADKHTLPFRFCRRVRVLCLIRMLPASAARSPRLPSVRSRLRVNHDLVPVERRAFHPAFEPRPHLDKPP